MPRSLSYLLVIVGGLIAGNVAAHILAMNPVAFILGMYAAGLILFLLGIDAVLSSEGVRGFFRDAGEAGRHFGVFLISGIASVGLWIALALLTMDYLRGIRGLGLLASGVPAYITNASLLLLIPLLTLAALWVVVAGLEFWAARSRWWGRTRVLIMEGRRGRVGLVLAAALIAAVIISVIRWEIQLLAIVSVGAALFVLWLVIDRLLPRSRIWAVARQTVAEALHYKLVVAWVLVMLLLVFALPPVITGDGVTLKSRVQSYLGVTLAIIGGGLGLLTVGLSAYTLPTEIVKKQIFLVASKPIPRWQIFAGKWLGIGVLNAGLLLFSGAAVWGFTWYLKNEPASLQDRLALEQEVLKVRQGVRLEQPPDLAAQVEASVRKMRESGDLNEAQEAEVRTQRLEQARRNWRSIPPRSEQTYTFRGLRVDREEQGFLHIRMKPDSASGVDDLLFPVVWFAGDPKDRNTLTPVRQQDIPAKRVTTLVVPAYAVGADGTVQFHMANLSRRDSMIFEGDDSVELLFGLGTFHWNLVRTLAIIWCRLAFVSALGMFLSTFLDFPVAFVCTLGLFAVSLGSSFLTESLSAAEIRPDGKDPIWGPLKLGYVLVPVGKAVVWSLPNFSKYDAAENVVSGRLVPIMWVVLSFVPLVVCWCGAMGALGCALLTKRELARDGT